jgi:hypothetical protein
MSESNFFNRSINNEGVGTAIPLPADGDVPAGVTVVDAKASAIAITVKLPDATTNGGRCITVVSSDVSMGVTVTSPYGGNIIGLTAIDAGHRSLTYCSDGVDWYASITA